MSGPEGRRRAVDLYFTTPMTTAQVVEHLGYPTRQCLERRLAKDPRYAGHMAKPIIPLETGTKAIEPVPGDMRQKQAAERLKAAAAGVTDDPVLHDLAMLKAVMVAGPAMDAAERDQILSALSKPGAPYELLALEQKAVALIGAGRNEDAITLIGQIQQKDGLSEPLRRRLSEMMITLGAEAEPNQGPGPQSMPAPPVN